MKHVLRLSMADYRAEQLAAADDEVHFSEMLVRTILEEYTVPGDRVLDPFAGFGTTLAVSGALGRVAVGVELLAERVEIIRGRVGPGATVVEGDARKLDQLGLEPFDLCLPPYMPRENHPWNPLTGYTTLDADYDVYLGELRDVFAAVERVLRPGGHVAVNAANMRHHDKITPLAWDMARVISEVPLLEFRGETYLEWDEPPDWMQGDYCLLFRKRYEPESAGY
jgi:SAM-dependent methyltransferase